MKKNAANHYLKPRPPFHAYLDIVKKFQRDKGILFKENWHEEMQFYYITEGVALLRCEADTIEMRAGDIAIINSNELHSLENQSAQLSYYVLRLDTALLFDEKKAERADDYAALLAQRLIVFRHLVRDDQQLLGILQTLLEEEENQKAGFELAIESAILCLLTFLVRHYIAAIYTKERFESRKNSLNQFKGVMNWLHDHYQETVSVSSLARQALMSEAHFCRVFKKIYGKTLIQYVHRLRIDKANELLIHTPATITEIALEVGFNDPNYFSRVFKHLKGIPPQIARTNYARKVQEER